MKEISLKDFLKKFTAVPNKFVDEYYNFYDMCIDNSFGIEGSLIIKYLSLDNVIKFYERVRSHFKENLDYIVKAKNIGPNNKNIYYFTFACFEKICMASKSSKGTAARNYMVIVRQFVEYYKNNFAQTIYDMSKSGNYVYIILVNKGKKIFKIGVTQNMRNRLRVYATGQEKHPDIKFIMAIKNKSDVEMCIKQFGKKHQYVSGRELYKIDFDTLKNIATKCGIIAKELSDSKCKDCDTYIVFDSSPYIQSNVKKSSKKITKKTSKKITKNASKRKSSKRVTHKKA